MTSYEMAKDKYAAWGVDTEKAMEQLKKVPVSLHCWQLDDVMGFDNIGDNQYELDVVEYKNKKNYITMED